MTNLSWDTSDVEFRPWAIAIKARYKQEIEQEKAKITAQLERSNIQLNKANNQLIKANDQLNKANAEISRRKLKVDFLITCIKHKKSFEDIDWSRFRELFEDAGLTADEQSAKKLLREYRDASPERKLNNKDH